MAGRPGGGGGGRSSCVNNGRGISPVNSSRGISRQIVAARQINPSAGNAYAGTPDAPHEGSVEKVHTGETSDRGSCGVSASATIADHTAR